MKDIIRAPVFVLFIAITISSVSAARASSIPSPSGLQNQCNVAGNQITLSWNPVGVADFYLLRLNDTTEDSSGTTQWGWYTPGTTDVDNDDVLQTTYTTPVVPGINYQWWVPELRQRELKRQRSCFWVFHL